MKTIPLTKGKFAVVDDDDYEWLSKLKWCSHGPYAARGIHDPHTQKTNIVLMHRVIMGTPEGCDTDHINGDRLDNRKENLRTATRAQNIANVKKANRHNCTGLRGVQMTPTGRYYAGIVFRGKRRHLGMFSCPLKASEAYQAAKLELYGEYSPTKRP